MDIPHKTQPAQADMDCVEEGEAPRARPCQAGLRSLTSVEVVGERTGACWNAGAAHCDMRSTANFSGNWGYTACLGRLSPPLMFENPRMPNGTSEPSLGPCGVVGSACKAISSQLLIENLLNLDGVSQQLAF